MSMRCQLSWWIATLAVALLPLAEGGYPQLADSLFTLFAGAALLLSPRASTSSWLSLLAKLTWLTWLAWQCIQLVPLPNNYLEMLAPASAAIWIQNGTVIPSLSPRIALFPAESIRMLVASLGLYCLWETLRCLHAVTPQLARRTLLVFVCAGLFQALYGTLAYFDIWTLALLEPNGLVHADVAHGSFANRNHYAAYLVLCAASVLALMLSPRRASSRYMVGPLRQFLEFASSTTPVYRTTLLIIVIAIVLTQSRMGNTAFGVGLGTFALAWALQTRDLRSFTIAILVFASILLVDILVISERFGLEKVVQRIEQTDLDTDSRSKARKIGDSMLATYLPGGAGLGSFGRLEPLHTSRFGEAPFAYAHNDHQQLLIEAGLPGYTLLGFLVLMHAFMGAWLLRSKRSLHRGIGAATLMVLVAASLHCTVEFLAYTPGWRAQFVALLGVSAGLPTPRSTHFFSMPSGDKNRR